MPQFENMNDVEKFLLKTIKECMIEVGKKVNDRLKSHIDEEVYIDQNKVYNDTYEFRESVTTSPTKQEGNSTSIEVYHDTNKMYVNSDNFTHGSNYWVMEDVRELLPGIIEYGLAGDIFGQGFWTKKRPYMSNTIKELKKKKLIKKWLKEAFEKRGIQTK